MGIKVDPKPFENLEGIYLHWYGKIVRKDRKVGHITIVGESVEELDKRVEAALEMLST